MSRVWQAVVGLALLAFTCPVGVAQAPDANPPAATAGELNDLLNQLGDESWEKRDTATRQLISMGLRIRGELQTRLANEPDLEIQYRIRYVLENIVAPDSGVLVIRADPAIALQPGDLITHVGGRRVTSAADLRVRLESANAGAMLRVIGASGPRDVGPVVRSQLEETADYVAPRGELIALAVRQFATGYAEEAYNRILELDAIPENELSRPLRARIAYCAGDGAKAIGLMEGLSELVRSTNRVQSVWSSPSDFDLKGPGKAPFHLELVMFNEGGPLLYESKGEDPDLRVQRVFVPAGRYMDALLRSAEMWTKEYHLNADSPQRSDINISGNQLAIASWMFSELGLRSECCRLIEPRSAILRQMARAGRKWVRVETDAWLPLLAGDEKGAVDRFYDAAIDILQQPRQADVNAVIRNPLIAARIAFFLYQVPEDRRTQEALAAIARPTHPALQEYVDWMLAALQDNNQDVIRRHLQSILPKLPDTLVAPYARAVVLIEYAQERPENEVLLAARQRIFQSAPGPQRDLWLAIVDALVDLTAGRAAEALQTLEPVRDRPEVAALLSTAQFLAKPPAVAANHELLHNPLLVVPGQQGSGQWIVLARDRRIMLLDEKAGTLVALPRAEEHWYPSPLTWPWLSREPSSGRVWAYARRRVLEITPGQAQPLKINIRTRDIPLFDRYLSAAFSTFADAVNSAPVPAGENGEFMRSEIKKHADCVADPDLPDLGLLHPLAEDPRLVHIAMRGGPHLLLDTTTGKAWSSQWIAQQLGLQTPPIFFAQALWPQAGESPVAMLMTDQGLMRFHVAQQAVTRIAIDVPGDDPYPKLVPESAPYERHDPRFVYCARLPEDGGAVYRLIVATGQVEPVDMVNEALPRGYYDVHLRSEIRRDLDARLAKQGLTGVESFISDAITTVESWEEQKQEKP